MGGIRTGCRSPGVEDFVFFYGADAVSERLQEYATDELRKPVRRVDWWGVMFSLVGIAASESVKVGVNRGLCKPLETLGEQKRSGRNISRRFF